MLTLFPRAVLSTIAFVSLSRDLPAAVIYSTFNNNDGGTQSNVNISTGKAVAFNLPAGTSYTLNNLQFRFSGDAPSSSIVVSLYNNDGSNTPGTKLADFSAQSSFTLNATPATYTFVPTAAFTLTAGTTYWVTLNTTEPPEVGNKTLAWRTSNPQPAQYSTFGLTTAGAVFGTGNNPGTWTSVSSNINSLTIDATAIPEPNPALLLSTILAICLMRRRRHSF